MPRLSVCVPTYNGAPFLQRCLRSLLQQEAVLAGHIELRIIVGDDASTDASVEVARTVQDPRVEVHAFANNLGLAGNWNRTQRLADGDYVSLVGQDDHVDPHWAGALIGLLEDFPAADLAFGRRRFAFADEESRRIVGDFFENRYPRMLEPFFTAIAPHLPLIPAKVMVEQAMRHCFEINLIGEPSFVIVRAGSKAARTGFDASMRQMIDWEYYQRCFVDRPLAHTPEIVGTYHIHAAASSMENAPLSRHYHEYDYLLGIVMERFSGMLSAAERQRLMDRRTEVRELQREHEARESRPT